MDFILLEKTFNQVMGTAMGTKVAPSYTDLSTRFLEESILFPVELKHFSNDSCKLIKK